MNDFLFSPTKQFLFPSGKILAGGKIYVFIKHTDNLATLYNDEDVEIANPVILDSNGRATVKADDTYDYKLDVYSPYDELLFTATSYLTDNFERDFAITSTDGSVDVNVSIDGYTTNWDLSVSGSINEATSGKFDTTAFENFYTNTYGPTVSNINQKIDYVSGAVDDLSATISGGYNSKLDVTAFNLYSAGVRSELNVITGNTAALGANTGLLSDRIVQNMNDINAVSGGLNVLNQYTIPDIRLDVGEISGKLDTVSANVANKLDSTAFNDFISNSYSPNMTTIFGDIGSLRANKEDKITWAYNNDGEISAANGSALAGKGYYSNYAPYNAQSTSGNLLIEGSRYPRQTLLEVSGENSVATAGIIPKVPEQNMSATRILVAASGALADVGWQEFDLSVATAIDDKLDWSAFTAWSAGPYLETSYAIKGGLSSLSAYVDDCCSSLPETYVPYSATTITTASTAQLVDTDTVETMIISATSAIDTFSGVTTDSTLTGDGKNDPLGVAEVQTLSSDESISITSGDNEVILGVNSSWFDDAVNSAYTGTTFTGVIHDNNLTGDGKANNLGLSSDIYLYESYGQPSITLSGYRSSRYDTIKLLPSGLYVTAENGYSYMGIDEFGARFSTQVIYGGSHGAQYGVSSYTLSDDIYSRLSGNSHGVSSLGRRWSVTAYPEGEYYEQAAKINQNGFSVIENHAGYQMTEPQASAFYGASSMLLSGRNGNYLEIYPTDILINGTSITGGTSIDFHYIEV